MINFNVSGEKMSNLMVLLYHKLFFETVRWARIAMRVDELLLLALSKTLSRGRGEIAEALDECPELSDLMNR